jgi:hypothetical protein
VSTGHFDNDDHAILTGMLLGHMLERGLEVEPVMDGSDYTCAIRIMLPSLIGMPISLSRQVTVTVQAPRKRP